VRRTAPSLGLGLAAALLPGAASAHDAFGDLGPFYASLLHPLADPAQGLLIAAVAVLLARQPLATVRPAYAALALCGALAMALPLVAAPAPPGPRATGLAVAALGLAAVLGLRLPAAVAAGLAAAVALAAGLAVDLPPGGRAAGLAAAGGAAGIALGALLVWGGVDYASRRLGRVAGQVAGAWIAAIGVMSAALPA
jgi:urease accessory protein